MRNGNPIPHYSRCCPGLYPGTSLLWSIKPTVIYFINTPLIPTATQITLNSVLSDIPIPPPSTDSIINHHLNHTHWIRSPWTHFFLPCPHSEAKIHVHSTSLVAFLFNLTQISLHKLQLVQTESPHQYPIPHTLGSSFLPPPFSSPLHPPYHQLYNSLLPENRNITCPHFKHLLCTAPFCIDFTHFMLLLASYVVLKFFLIFICSLMQTNWCTNTRSWEETPSDAARPSYWWCYLQ